ncbi:MAG: hypothetical protein AB7H96_21195 [Vicinamibacterales bacterium]
MDTFVTWLQATSLSQAIVFNTWVWPIAETLHFIGLALVLGIVGFFDLRLMGFYRRISLVAAHDLVPVALVGFALNLITGIVFLIGHPEQYVHNVAWWWKVGCLAVAGANAAAFELSVGQRTMALGDGADTPGAAKAIGFISVVAWLGVLYFGRMLPFIGNAY